MMVQIVQTKYTHKRDRKDGGEGEISSSGRLVCNRGSALNIATHMKMGTASANPRTTCGKCVMRFAKG
jgi:hypothetical protein